MLSAAQLPWWRGTRGEWYVPAQFCLLLLAFFGPRTLPGLPAWPVRLTLSSTIGGAALIFAGGSLLLAGLLRLGVNLTPLPYPKEHSTLVRTGAYRIVRHPVYGGTIAFAYGWALVVHSWLTLVYATILFLFFEIKAAREERWLIEKFPDYPAYQRRVCKFIPFIH